VTNTVTGGVQDASFPRQLLYESNTALFTSIVNLVIKKKKKRFEAISMHGVQSILLAYISMFGARIHSHFFLPYQIWYTHCSEGVLDASTCTAHVLAYSAQLVLNWSWLSHHRPSGPYRPVHVRAVLDSPLHRAFQVWQHLKQYPYTRAPNIQITDISISGASVHQRLLSTSPNLVYPLPSPLPQRHPGRLYMHSPRAGPVSPLK
jgi:hypothetical protein